MKTYNTRVLVLVLRPESMSILDVLSTSLKKYNTKTNLLEYSSNHMQHMSLAEVIS